MRLLENKKIAIIGAGPVGLTMATLLQQMGADVAVYERDKDENARVWGGTLDLHEGSGKEAMEKAALLDSYYELAKPMGRVITDEQSRVFFSKAPDHDNPEINRNNLRKMLLGSLQSGTVIWDRKLAGLEVADGKWHLHFESQADETADVIIVANGGMSKARAYVSDTEVEHTGTYIIQGEVEQAEAKCAEFCQLSGKDNILMTASNGINFVANPDNNGALTYAVTFRNPDKGIQENGLDFRDTTAVGAFLSDLLPDWHACYHQLFRSTSMFVGLPARKFPLDKPWKENRPLPITLIGDAAHLMPPFAGQGVNSGMLDALTLSENLTGNRFQTIEAAIRDYEEKMFVYASEAQLQTSKNEIEMHQPGFSFHKRFSNG